MPMYFDTTTTDATTGLASGTWILDPVRSSLEFRVPLLYGKVGTVKGGFDRFRGTLDLAANPAVELAVAADSIDTGNRKRDEHLRSGDFFDADAHPEVRFESGSTALEGEALHIKGLLHAAGESVPLDSYRFRTAPRFETSDPALKWLETSTFVGVAARTPDRVAIGFHEVL